MLRFERFRGTLEEWGGILETYPDRQIFQTPAWLRFVAEAQNAEPVIAVLKDGDEEVGHFAGLVVKRIGFSILGTPLPGWSTSYMGIRLREGVSKRNALESLVRFAFRDLRCVHLEFFDRSFTVDDAAGLGFDCHDARGFEVDLSGSVDEVYARTSATACRYRVRKATKLGVVIEEAQDDAFADDYYAQLQEVFASQSLVPTYDKERVRLLMKHLLPTGMLLLLRARDAEGHCIATGIFPAMNRHMYFWGGASWRQYRNLSPNEPLNWHAIQYWKTRGMRWYDMCGGGEYKRKYGGDRICVPCFSKSRYRYLKYARDLTRCGFRLKQMIAGRTRRAA
jgi:hypothetical protein